MSWGVKGHRRSSFKKIQFLDSDCRFELNSMIRKCAFSIFSQIQRRRLQIRVKPLMTFDPQNMASRLTFNHFDSDFCVPWSICNQKLPDKLSWYEFDVFTGRSTLRESFF